MSRYCCKVLLGVFAWMGWGEGRGCCTWGVRGMRVVGRVWGSGWNWSDVGTYVGWYNAEQVLCGKGGGRTVDGKTRRLKKGETLR